MRDWHSCSFLDSEFFLRCFDVTSSYKSAHGSAGNWRFCKHWMQSFALQVSDGGNTPRSWSQGLIRARFAVVGEPLTTTYFTKRAEGVRAREVVSFRGLSDPYRSDHWAGCAARHWFKERARGRGSAALHGGVAVCRVRGPLPPPTLASEPWVERPVRTVRRPRARQRARAEGATTQMWATYRQRCAVGRGDRGSVARKRIRGRPRRRGAEQRGRCPPTWRLGARGARR